MRVGCVTAGVVVAGVVVAGAAAVVAGTAIAGTVEVGTVATFTGCGSITVTTTAWLAGFSADAVAMYPMIAADDASAA